MELELGLMLLNATDTNVERRRRFCLPLLSIPVGVGVPIRRLQIIRLIVPQHLQFLLWGAAAVPKRVEILEVAPIIAVQRAALH